MQRERGRDRDRRGEKRMTLGKVEKLLERDRQIGINHF